MVFRIVREMRRILKKNKVSLSHFQQLRMGSRNEANGIHGDNVEAVAAAALKTKLSNVAPLTSECCIYRVPTTLRKVNPEAYTPQLVSIGPFHHGTPRLQPMEVHKLRYLQKFLNKNSKNTIELYIRNLKGLEERARQCYDEEISYLTSDEFVQMMLTDGSYVIEFMLNRCGWLQMSNDFLENSDVLATTLDVDMYLLENQLPFFVLECLFNLLINHDPHEQPVERPFLELAIHFFTQILSGPQEKYFIKNSNSNVKHFVDLLRQSYVPSSQEKKKPKGNGDFKLLPSATELHEAGIKLVKIDHIKRPGDISFTEYGVLSIPRLQISSATELHEAGIKLVKRNHIKLRHHIKRCCDISFTENGVLSIPCLEISNDTEVLFRNIMALDFFHDHKDNYLTDYIFVMDSLINTPRDVALLRKCGIINNWSGDDEQVSRVFNKLCNGAKIWFPQLYYAQLCENVNAYYKKPWHVWRATLKREYFSCPWSTASVIAAIILLVCTMVQTICSVISLKG